MVGYRPTCINFIVITKFTILNNITTEFIMYTRQHKLLIHPVFVGVIQMTLRLFSPESKEL